MKTNMTRDDLDKIETDIRRKYADVAQNPEGRFLYPTGRKGLDALGYDPAFVGPLPEAVASSYCGVGNPFALGGIHAGESVLDFGCGAGVDAILAAMMAGPTGFVVGIDIVPEMIARAKVNLKTMAIDNLCFQTTAGERLPFPNDAFDVVISNGVFNLIPDKEGVLAEIHRVLKPGGRLMLADQLAVGSVQKDIQTRLANWFQ
jgi:SAM-dependent methyltransferase